jgi:glycosyltransferase involved in cell wall biosynthesis
MKKVKVLHIGIKNYPFNIAFSDENLVGLRGGGMNKYCDILINSISQEVESFLIVQKLSDQSENEYLDGVHVFRVSTKGSRRVRQIIASIKSFFLSINLIRKYKINIIHGHMIHGIFFAFLLSKLFRVKTVGTPYSFVTKGFSPVLNFTVKLIEKTVYKRVDVMIFETEGNQKVANEIRGLKLDNSTVINTGIEIPTIDKRQEQNKILKIYYIGRIVKIKALDNLIDGIALLTEEIRSQIFVDIIGEGELFDEYKKLVQIKNLINTINFHGFVDNIDSYLKNSDIFILPSHMEGLSISLMEAMSNSKACIVNDFGLPFSTEEVYIMKNNKPETIANAITYFVENREIIQVLGQNARNKIKEEFSIDSFGHKHISLYKDLIRK